MFLPIRKKFQSRAANLKMYFFLHKSNVFYFDKISQLNVVVFNERAVDRLPLLTYGLKLRLEA